MVRPLKVPDVSDKAIEQLAGIGCTLVEMEAVTGISVDTLERRYADIIQKGSSLGKQSLRHKQFQKAMEGDKTMLIWLGKQLLGQRDNVIHEVTGRDGGPIVSAQAVLTMDPLDVERRLQEARAKQAELAARGAIIALSEYAIPATAEVVEPSTGGSDPGEK